MKHESNATGTSRATCAGEKHEWDHLNEGNQGLANDLAEHDRVA